MLKHICWFLVAAICAVPVRAGSLTLGGLADTDDGWSTDLSGRIAVGDVLTLGAGVGHSRAKIDGEDLSGTTLDGSVDLDFGAFFANASAERWKDSGQLRSTMLHGEFGWMSDAGIALSLLATNHDMKVLYSTTLLGQTRERDIDFEGTGFGADVSYFGEQWTAGVRFLDYDYGNSVARVRAVLDSSDTLRFPRLQQLIGSVATRAAGAPDREASLVLGRQFARSSLTADLQWQRDALTGDKTKSAGLTLGLKPTKHFGVDVSGGVSDNHAAGTVPYIGLSLTFRDGK